MARYPKPDGPYDVGSVTHRLTDTSRPAHILSDRTGRELFLKLWYPSDANGEETVGDRECMWEQLSGRPDIPLPWRWMLAAPKRVRTCTRSLAPLACDVHTSRLTFYTHGLISFASENTSLAEALASHGCIVLAVEHVEQLPELQSLNRQQPADKRKRNAATAARLRKATPEERARMAPDYYKSAEITNQIVVARTADVSFALRHIDDIVERIPGFGKTKLDTDKIAIVGFSLGGAIATEFAASDGRTAAIVNLDGGFFGSRQGEVIAARYLMMYTSESEGINDALLPKQTRSITGPLTKHLNYHDIALVMPFLRYIGILGKARARDFIEFRNREICDFLLNRDDVRLVL
jgi:dienelactone hydrolase